MIGWALWQRDRWWSNEIGMAALESSSTHSELGIFSAFASRHKKTKRTCVEMADRRKFRIHTLRLSSNMVTNVGVDWIGDIALRIHKRSSRCRWAAATFSDRFSPKERAFCTDKRWCWTFPSFGEEEKLSPPPGIEPRFLGQPAVSLVTVSAELSQSLCSVHVKKKIWWISKDHPCLVDKTLDKLFLDILQCTCYEHRRENVSFAFISF
jgi:hypothetical protein